MVPLTNEEEKIYIASKKNAIYVKKISNGDDEYKKNTLK